MKRHQWVCLISAVLILTAPMTFPVLLRAEEKAASEKAVPLTFMEGEILEVNELKESIGSAIYKVRAFSTGETIELYADKDRSLIWAGEEPKKVTDVIGGTKANIIYRNSSEKNVPMIVFAKVANSNY